MRINNKILKALRNNLQYSLSVLLIAIIIVSGLVYLVRKPDTAEATWWDNTWSYRQSIAVTNSGSALTDFHLEILAGVDLSALVTAGKLQADLDDIRFTDINHRAIPFWIEDDTDTSVNAWVRIPSIPTTGTTIYVYYGNSNAVAASVASNIIGNSGYPGDSCTDIINKRDATDGVYYVRPGDQAEEFQIYCDMTTDDGGWSLVLQNNYPLGSPTPSWEEAVNDNNVTGSIGTDLTAFDVFVGVSYWDDLGTTARLEQGATPSSVDHQAYYILTLDSGNNYTLQMSSENITINNGGAASPGMYAYHNNKALTTYDADNDDNGGNCSTNYGNTAWWYGNCWNGNFWGYNNYAYWSGAGSCVADYCFDWGGIWLQGSVTTTSTAVGAPASEENAPGPIGVWHFDIGAGSTAYDATGYGNDGTITNALWSQLGRQGGALSFDGTTDYVTVSDDVDLNFNTGSFSVSAWVKSNQLGTTKFFVGKADGANVSTSKGYVLYLGNSGTVWIFGAWDGSSNKAVADPTAAVADTWYHVTGVFDSSSEIAYLYVNGELVNQSSNAALGDIDVGNDLLLGATSTNYFDGLVDEVYLYDRAISASEVKSLYNTGAAEVSFGHSGLPADCSEQLARYPGSEDGIYTIDPIGYDPFDVYCDMTTAGGGWTLIFQRRGDTANNNAESCGSNVNSFIRATCGAVTSLAYGDSYSMDIDKAPSYDQFLFKQYDSGMTFDSNDSFIIQTTNNIFPDITDSLSDTAVTAVCDYNNANCDSTDTYFKYTGSGYFSGSTCSNGYSVGYGGNYGYCQNGVGTAYASNGLFGDRSAYNETKLWSYSSGGDVYMERVFVRNTTPTTTQGLVLDMTFDHVSGSTVYDTSGNANNGTVTGAIQKSATHCMVGKCYQFNGGTDGINLGEGGGDFDFGSGDFTLAFWAKLDTHSDYSGFVTKVNGSYWSGVGFSFTTPSSPDTPYFRVVGDVTAIELNTGLGSSYDWSYFTGIRSGDTFTVYINGQYITSTTSAIGSVDNDSNLYIGKGNSASYDGNIDQVKIFDRALTQREIVMEMNSGQHQPVLDMNFNEGGGATAYDASGQGNNGTLQPNASWVDADDCIMGQCIYFDGTATNWNSIQITEDDSLDAVSTISVEAWVKVTESKTHQIIYKRMNGATPSWYSYKLDINSSEKPLFYVANTSGTLVTATADTAISLNVWYHLVGVYDGSNAYIYVDGLSADATPPALTGDVLDSDYKLMVGGLDASLMMKGYLDEVKIYPYALTADEIKEDFIKTKGQLGQSNAAGSIGTPVAGGALLDMDMDIFSTTYKDRSGNAYDCTIAGNPVQKSAVHCQSGKCVEFDGTGDYLNCGDIIDNGEITVTTWFNSTSSSPNDLGLFDLDGDGSYGGFIFNWSANKPLLYLNSGNFRYWVDSSSYMDGNWHFLTVYIPGSGQSDITNAVLTIDGNIITSDATNTSTVQSTWTTLHIGRGYSTSDWIGKIDQFRVYSGSLTKAEQAELYNGGQPISWWRFDEGAVNRCAAGEDACDSSGTGNNGTFVSTPTWVGSANCQSGDCLSFDGGVGSGDSITLGSSHIIDMTSATIAWWSKRDVLVTTQDGTNTNGALRLLDGGAHYKLLDQYVNDTYFQFRGERDVNEETWAIFTSSVVADTEWHHFVITADANVFKLYVDGEYDKTDDDSAAGYTSNVCTITDIAKGYPTAQATYGSYWDGDLDDMRFYNYPLTADQVKEVYNQGTVSFK